MVQHFHLFFFILALILYPSLVHAGKQRGGLLLGPVSCLVCSQHPLPCPPGTSILASCLMEKMGGGGAEAEIFSPQPTDSPGIHSSSGVSLCKANTSASFCISPSFSLCSDSSLHASSLSLLDLQPLCLSLSACSLVVLKKSLVPWLL